MNTQLKKKIRQFFPLGLLLGIPAIAVRTAAALGDLDYAYGRYLPEQRIRLSGWLILAAIAILAAVGALVTEKGERLHPLGEKESVQALLPTGLLGVTAFFAVTQLFAKKSLIASLSAFLMIGGIIFFILIIAIQERHSTTRAIFGLSEVLALILAAGFLYLDTSLVRNAPDEIADELALIAAALFLLALIRVSLGRDDARYFRVAGATASLLTAYASIPALIVLILKGECIADGVYMILLELAFLIFCVAQTVVASAADGDGRERVRVLLTAARSEEKKNRSFITKPAEEPMPADEEPAAQNDARESLPDDNDDQISFDNLIELQSGEESNEETNE